MAAWIPLATAGLSLAGNLFGGSDSDSKSSQATDQYQAALSRLANLQTKRISQADPVYQALVKMAYGRLPSYFTSGITAPGTTSRTAVSGARDRGDAVSRGTAMSRY